jgi:UDP-GlcNAc:undecaprenyl-phosphate/decaprenyl-phosphate GlcNAc-1-phosphate transferase
MWNLAPEFAVALVASLALVPACRFVSTRAGRVAHPREDRWHRRPVALFGGAGIAIAIFGTALGFQLALDLPVLLGCALVIFALGFVDDLISLKPSTKLIVEIAVASALLFAGHRLNWMHSITLDWFLTLVWVVGMTNAFNLLDNMDGLCAGTAIIVATAFLANLVAGATGVPPAEARYLAVLMGATLGFLVYNFHPASIFMGDSGSLLLGFSFAALTLSVSPEAGAKSNVLTIVAAPVLVLLLPILDTTLVTVSRMLAGRSASVGGRDHSSHRLVALGLSERAAVVVLWLLAGIGGLLGVAVNHIGETWSIPAALAFVLAMILIAVYLARIRVYEGDDARLLREGTVTPIVADFMYKRRVAEVLLDLCLITLAYYAAYRLRFEGGEFLQNFESLRRTMPIVLAAQLLAFFGVGVYRGMWRHFGLNDTVVVVEGALAGSACAWLVIVSLPMFISYSRTVFAIDFVLVVGLVTLSRASFRLIAEFVQRRRRGGSRVLIYGAGDGGTLAVRELLSLRDRDAQILGFADDDERKKGSRVAGYRVLGDGEALRELVASGGVDAIVVSSRAIADEQVAPLAALCARHGVTISRLQVSLEAIAPKMDGVAGAVSGASPRLTLAARNRGKPN